MRFPITLMAASMAVLGAVAGCAKAEDTAPATGRVEFADVSAGIYSSGSLSALSEANLGFEQGGQLTSVLVKVGDHVTAGQELATIDPAPARAALDAQRAQLRAQEALLAKAEDSSAVSNAKDSRDQAKDILDAVRRQAERQDQADSVAISNAQRQQIAAQNAANNAGKAQTSACAGGPSAQCTSAQQAYAQANQNLVIAQSALRSAIQQRSLDQSSSRVLIENARQGVVTAANLVDSSRSDRPHDIDQQRALVAAARAAVSAAQRDLSKTTLRAPADGTVTALNGAPGEYVSPSSGTSALAPGTDATIPGSSGASSGGTSAASAVGVSASLPARPGGSQFLVLSDIDQLQVVALFNESDAAELRDGQSVRVTFDALPDVTAEGTVASVAPAVTAISGVISYYVTVNVDTDDPRLKPGQTATVGVITEDRGSVLSVPNAAVRSAGGRSVVTVVEQGRRRTVPFEAGAVGPDRTEVVSGLREGQLVVVPRAAKGDAGRDGAGR